MRARIDKIECSSGEWEMEVETGWHDYNKNEVADVIVELNKLDYLRDLSIDSVEEDYKYLVLVGLDDDGNYLFAVKPKEKDDDPTEYVEADKMDDAEKEEYGDMPVITKVKSKYKVKCHIGYPEEVEAAASEEGGAAE